MKLRIDDTKDLYKSLKAMSAIVSRTNILPITECVLIEADNIKGAGEEDTVVQGFVRFTATDLVARISITGEVTVEKPGKTCIKLAEFLNILQNAGDELLLDVTKTGAKIAIEGANYSLRTANPADYPSMDVKEFGNPISVNSSELARAIESVKDFTLKSDDALSNILLSSDGDSLSLTATDRAIMCSTKIPAVQGEEFRVSIPPPALAAITKLADPEENVSLQFNESQMRIVLGNAEVITTQSAHAFPKMDQAINMIRGYTFKAKMTKKKLADGLKKLAFLGGPAVVLDFEPESLTLSAGGKGSGQVTLEDMDAPGKLTISCAFGSLQKGLEAIQTPDFYIGAPDEGAKMRAGLVMVGTNQVVSCGEWAGTGA